MMGHTHILPPYPLDRDIPLARMQRVSVLTPYDSTVYATTSTYNQATICLNYNENAGVNLPGVTPAVQYGSALNGYPIEGVPGSYPTPQFPRVWNMYFRLDPNDIPNLLAAHTTAGTPLHIGFIMGSKTTWTNANTGFIRRGFPTNAENTTNPEINTFINLRIYNYLSIPVTFLHRTDISSGTSALWAPNNPTTTVYADDGTGTLDFLYEDSVLATGAAPTGGTADGDYPTSTTTKGNLSESKEQYLTLHPYNATDGRADYIQIRISPFKISGSDKLWEEDQSANFMAPTGSAYNV